MILRTLSCRIILYNLAVVAISMVDAFGEGEESRKVNRAFLKDIPRWMEEFHVPVVGVGIVEAGAVVEVKMFGELEKGHAAPENTLFSIASQTKPVIAMLVVKLVQDGRWKLDEPLANDWTDPDVAADARSQRLTTRHVLTHQTGFPNWRSSRPGGKLSIDFDPGTKFQYSGEGFEYLKKALENRFETSLDTLLKEVILDPFDLKETRYWGSEVDASRFARWHDANGKRYARSPATKVSAASDLISTVEDYCNIGCLVMGDEWTLPSLAKEMRKAQVTVKPHYHRALGWGRIDGLPDGEYGLEHGGADLGRRTMAVFLPVSKRGLVIMTNGDNGGFLIDRAIGAAFRHGQKIVDAINKPATEPTKVSLPAKVLLQFEGRYRRPNGEVLQIAVEENGIKVSGDGIPTAVLVPLSKSEFFLPNYDVRMKFLNSKPTAKLQLEVSEQGNVVLTAEQVQ